MSADAPTSAKACANRAAAFPKSFPRKSRGNPAETNNAKPSMKENITMNTIMTGPSISDQILRPFARRLLRAVLAVGAVLALFAATTTWAQPNDPHRVDKVSANSFAQTVEKLEAALKAEHMMIVAKVDHKNMLSMTGAKMNGATTVEFGKPEMGKMLLPMNAAIGLEMPGRIYVFEAADGKTVVSFRKVASQYATYGSPEVQKAGEMMDMMVDKLTSAVVQR